MKTQQHARQGCMEPLISIKKLSLGELFILLNLITLSVCSKRENKKVLFLLAQQLF